MAGNSLKNALAYDDYTVGWVCALPKELVAAIAMLDQRHEALPRRLNDHNSYSLGSIGNHNVVIACLPKGRIGTMPAAVVAKNMAETFPFLRILLMVGIGGGIPPKVRLGDVVASVPDGVHPGVVQWDMGKTVDGGMFERTGSLDKPPASLLTAISKLEADHGLGESKILTYLKEAETKFPKLADKCLRSADLVDVLFKAKYSHIKKPEDEDEEEDDDETCKDCDKTETIKRKDRDMMIHYGLIASGNQVIKDAARRNSLNKDLGGKVLCIEMEAAGLMDHFPCLVIRGICDYADSHKNKAWQEHAAAVAAAFAKELLHYVPPDEVQMERRVKDSLSALEQHVVQLKLQASKSEDTEILDWLTKHDYGLQYSDFLKRRQPGTGQWLLHSDEYRLWRETPNQTLFCPGIPGAGKTIMASIIVEDLYTCFNDGDTGIAYIFCNFRRGDEQHLEDLTASLLKQLSQGQSPLPESLKTSYEKHKGKGTRPGFDEIFQILFSTATMYSRSFFIIDALDECQISQDCRNKFLDAVFSIQKKAKLNLCITSRHIPEIEERFTDCTILQIHADAEDMQRYLQDHISELTLAWITYAKRPLTVNELRTALSIQEGALTFDERDLIQADMVSICAGLVTIDEESRVIRLVHYTVQEYFESTKDQWFPKAQQIITTACVTYLLFEDFSTGLCRTDEELEERLQGYPFYDYAAQNWGHHALEITEYRLVLTFLEKQSQLEASTQVLLLDQHSPDHFSRNMNGPHLAAFFGLEAVVQEQQYKWDLNSQDHYNRTPLSWAAERGHEAIIQLLLKAGAEIDSKDKRDRTPLFWAASGGHEAVVKLLLEAGAEIDSKDEYNQTPLGQAADEGHEAVVKLLLKAGAKVNLKNGPDETPLARAASHGHEAIVKLFLEAGAKVDSKNAFSSTPLLQVAYNGHEAIAKLLLEAGAKVDSKDVFDSTPLSQAAYRGHEAIVQLLLEASAKVDSMDELRETLLSCGRPG
ncbi:hypothetical protein ACHAQJ_003744 [Trichoderma viride]